MVTSHSYVKVYQRVTTTGNQGVEPCASAGTSPLSLPLAAIHVFGNSLSVSQAGSQH